MAYRRKDSSTRNVVSLVKATGFVLTQGDLVMKNGTSNNFVGMTSGSALLGIALASAASSSTATIDIDLFITPDVIVGDVTGTAPSAGDMKSCDLSTQALVSPSTNTNHDFFYMYNGTSTTVDLIPHKLESNTAA